MPTRTEGFQLVSLLIVVALCAIALFTGFHALATSPQARIEQSGIVLEAPQSMTDSEQSGIAPASQPQQPTAPPPDEGQDVSPSPEPSLPVQGDDTPAATPSPAPGPIVVTPAPVVDLDDDDDDDNDDDDDDDDRDD